MRVAVQFIIANITPCRYNEETASNSHLYIESTMHDIEVLHEEGEGVPATAPPVEDSQQGVGPAVPGGHTSCLRVVPGGSVLHL